MVVPYRRTLPDHHCPTGWGWWSVVGLLTTAVAIPGVGGQSLSEADKIGIIVGCSLGGIILIVLIFILIILLCKPRRHSKYGDDDASSNHSTGGSPKGPHGKYAGLVPPGIWTTKPTMVVGAPHHGHPHPQQQPQGGGYPPPPQEGAYPSPRSAQESALMVAAMQDGRHHRQPWYRRTVRQVQKSLKRFPSYFQVKRSGGNQSAQQGGVWTSAASPRQRRDSNKTEVEKAMSVAPETVKASGKSSKMESAQEIASAFKQNEELTARAQCNTDQNDDKASETVGSPTSQSSNPFVAKVFSDFKTPRGTSGPSVARAFSSYGNGLDSNVDGSERSGAGVPGSGFVAKAVIRSESKDSAGYANPQEVLYGMTQSDWTMYRPSKPVTRTQSNMEHQRDTTLQRNPHHHQQSRHQEVEMVAGRGGAQFPHNPYGRGTYMRSPSDAQAYAHKKAEYMERRQQGERLVAHREENYLSQTLPSLPVTNFHRNDGVSPRSHPQPVPVHQAQKKSTQSSHTKAASKPQAVAAAKKRQKLSGGSASTSPRPKPTPVLPSTTPSVISSSTAKLPRSDPPADHKVARVYSNPPSASSSTRASTRLSQTVEHYPAPNDPEALYAAPLKLIAQGSKVARQRSAHEAETSDPPPLPPPNFLHQSGATQRSHGSDSNRLVVEATIEKGRPKSGKGKGMSTTKSMASASSSVRNTGKIVVGDAFRFLEDFDDTMSFDDELDK